MSIHKRRTWADWLQFKAAGGDDEALKTLRQRNAQQARKANILHGDKVKKDGRIPGLKPDSVTKEGTIIYRVGESAIRDGGKRLDVSRDAGDDGHFMPHCLWLNTVTETNSPLTAVLSLKTHHGGSRCAQAERVFCRS
ncbi:hypothetical protein [Enterobacter kobei]